MNKNKFVLFDIDYTLFDKDLFLDSLFESIGIMLDIDKKIMWKIGNVSYRQSVVELDHFDPKYFSLKVAEGLDRLQSLRKIENAVSEKYNSPGSLYKETLETIEEISRIAKIGILSKGHDVFQKNKINKFRHLLEEDHIYITKDKYETLLSIIHKYNGLKLFLIDDLLDVLYSAKKIKPDIITIWVKRGIYAENKKPIPGFLPDAEVANLSEVVRIVRSNS
jgi:FMN phosphatase YigB (HAD superfamily)